MERLHTMLPEFIVEGMLVDCMSPFNPGLGHADTMYFEWQFRDGSYYLSSSENYTDLFKGVLDMNEVGYLNVKSPSTATNIPGVFAAGDVADPTYRQAITAAGMGAAAAIDADQCIGFFRPCRQ